MGTNDNRYNALETAIGAAVLRRDNLADVAKDEKKKKVLEKFFVVIDKATKVVSFAEKLQTLGAPTISLLLE